MKLTRSIAALAFVIAVTPALAQPTTGEQAMAGKIDCANFQAVGNGSWTGKDGKAYGKTSHMAIALQQKCTSDKKR